MKKAIKQKDRLTKYIFIFLSGVLFIVGLLNIGIVPERLVNSIERGIYVFSSMFPPSLNEPTNVLTAAIESIQVAIIGTLFGIIFSSILAIFAARNLTPHFTISYLIKAVAGFVRAIPALIWAILFIIAVGLGTVPGIMALAVNSIGMLTKVYAEAIEEIDKKSIEAIRAVGGNRTHVIIQAILPNIMNTFISWSVFRFDINIRYASILGVVGAGGIGHELMRASRLADYQQVMGITLIIFLMIVAVEYISRFLRTKFNI